MNRRWRAWELVQQFFVNDVQAKAISCPNHATDQIPEFLNSFHLRMSKASLGTIARDEHLKRRRILLAPPGSASRGNRRAEDLLGHWQHDEG